MSPFIGRHQELEVLKLSLPGTAGNGRFVAVTGEAGMGKTRLITEIAEIGTASGQRVLWSQMLEDPSVPPYFPWMLALRSCIRQCDAETLSKDLGSGALDVADIVPELHDKIGPRERQYRSGKGQTRYQLFDSVTRFLLAVAGRHPLLLLFDNLHSADRSSLDLLEYFCQQVSGSPVLVVAAYRESEIDRHHPLRAALNRLTRCTGHLRLVLAGLSRNEVAELLHARLGFVLPGSLVDSIYRQSDGNPLFVSEVANMLAHEQANTHLNSAGVQFDVPASLRDVIGARLDSLPADVCSLLRKAAVLGREFDIAALVNLESSRLERVVRQLQRAEAAGVIMPARQGRVRFRHALFREVLYAEQSKITRVILHRRAGEQLESRHSGSHSLPVSELAYHFFEAARIEGDEKAIFYCRLAAESAIAKRAYGDAVALLDCALQLIDLGVHKYDDLHIDLLLAMGQAQYQAAELTAATRTLMRSAVLAYQRQRWKLLANVLYQFQLICQQSGHRHVASIPLHKAVLENLPEEEHAVRARVLASLANAYRMAADPDLAATTLRQSIALARRCDDRNVLLDCLRKGNWVLGRAPTAIHEGLKICREAYTLAKAQRNPEAVLDAVADCIFQLCDLGEIDEIQQLIEELKRISQEERLPHFRNVLIGFETALAILRGRWNEALRGAMAGVRELPLQDVRGLRGRFAFQIFAIRKAQGSLHEVEDVAERIIAKSGETQMWLPGQALLYCELGKTSLAREVLGKIGDLRALPDDDLRQIALIYLAETCVALGDRKRCAEIYDLLLPYRGLNATLPGTLILGAVSGYLATLAVATKRYTEAKSMFEEAVIMNRRMGALPALARTQVDFARLLLRSESRQAESKARRLIAEAGTVARELGLQPVLHAIEELNELSGVERLTGREIDVLKTIATGLSNNAIAELLNISHSTVATHVRNIFRKISVTNRTEAADFARRAGLFDHE